jgi:hypothetical protein
LLILGRIDLRGKFFRRKNLKPLMDSLLHHYEIMFLLLVAAIVNPNNADIAQKFI